MLRARKPVQEVGCPMGVMLVGFLGLSAANAGLAPLLGKTDTVVLREPAVYVCFPFLWQEGDVLHATVGTRVRVSHIDATGGSRAMTSTDGGLTWREDQSTTGPCWRFPSGRLLWANGVGWEEYPAEKQGELESHGLEVRPVREGVVAVTHRAVARYSDDHGLTWRTLDIPVPRLALLMGFHGGVLLCSGVVLVPVYGREKVGDAYRAWVLRSADEGENWDLLPMAEDPQGKIGFDEASLLELPEGRVLAMIRTENADGFMYQVQSPDEGLTWSEPESSGIWGHPPNLLLLQSRRILCTYGYRRPPYGVRAVLSSDGGTTWHPADGIVLRDDGASRDLGYPMSAQLSDGRIVTVYYFTDAQGVTFVAASLYEEAFLAQ